MEDQKTHGINEIDQKHIKGLSDTHDRQEIKQVLEDGIMNRIGNELQKDQKLVESISYIMKIFLGKGVPTNKDMNKHLPNYSFYYPGELIIKDDPIESNKTIAYFNYYPNTLVFETFITYGENKSPEKIIIDGQEVERVPITRSIKLHLETGERVTDSAYKKDRRFTKDHIENRYPYDDTVFSNKKDKDGNIKTITNKEQFKLALEDGKKKIESMEL